MGLNLIRSFVKFSAFLMIVGAAQASLARDVVVLVPGFFNSFAPEYFSRDIVNSFKQKGFQVYVIDKLNAIGHIEENGTRLEAALQQIEKTEGGHVAFNIVAHSAGGFYSMWVANRQKFEIKNILTVATPYKGVDFVDDWKTNSWMFRELISLAHLDGLEELTPQGAALFTKTIRLNPKTKMFTFGGFQSAGLDITDARNLSVPMRVTDHFTKGLSDGIVSFGSAVGISGMKALGEVPALAFKDEKFMINLEHWEQVLDYRSFVILGIRNRDYIRNEQIRFYTGLANLLLTQK